MSSLIARLLADGPVLTDGAWGTQLQERGLPLGGVPDQWNLSHADVVLQVAESYVAAGSRVLLTNTFGSNRARLRETDWADDVQELNRSGVEISRKAAAGHAYVFGSIGPSGEILISGDISPEDLDAIFSEQAQALADAGADALVIETMTDVAEAEQAVRSAKATGLPVIACMVFDSGKDGDRTMMGHTPEQAAMTLSAAGADVIGANCGHGIRGFVPICRRLRAATRKPIWIKANAGLPEMVNGRIVYHATPDEFAQFVPTLCEAGANFIGGCCGTGPEFIAHMHSALSMVNKPPVQPVTG